MFISALSQIFLFGRLCHCILHFFLYMKKTKIKISIGPTRFSWYLLIRPPTVSQTELFGPINVYIILRVTRCKFLMHAMILHGDRSHSLHEEVFPHANSWFLLLPVLLFTTCPSTSLLLSLPSSSFFSFVTTLLPTDSHQASSDLDNLLPNSSSLLSLIMFKF